MSAIHFSETITIPTNDKGAPVRWNLHDKDPGCMIASPIKPDLEDPATEMALTALWTSTHDLLAQAQNHRQKPIKMLRFTPAQEDDRIGRQDRLPTIPRPMTVKTKPKQFVIAQRAEDGGYEVEVSLAHNPGTNPKAKSAIISHASYLIGTETMSISNLHRTLYSLPDFQGNLKVPQFTPAVLRPHVVLKALVSGLQIVHNRFAAVPTPLQVHGPSSEWRIT